MSIVVTSNNRPRNNKPKNKPKSKNPTVKIEVKDNNKKSGGKKKNKRSRKGKSAMSECARKYYVSIQRPFAPEALGCCLPYPPDRDSLKVTSIARFNLTLSAAGKGVVYFSPSLANDATCLWYTNAADPTPIFTVGAVDTAPAGMVSLMHNGPFSRSQLTQTGFLEGRIVSCGFRVQYLSSVSAMSGTYASYVDPAHACVNAAQLSPLGNLYTALETRIVRITDRAFEQGFTVVRESEHSYASSSDTRGAGASTGNLNVIYPWSNGIDVNGTPMLATGWLYNGAPIAMLSVSGASSGSQFYVEYIQHMEFVGKGASYGLTPSHNDHNAANVISAAADRAPAEALSNPGSPWSDIMSRAMSKVASHAASSMGRTVATGVLAAARGVGPRRGQLAIR